MLAALLLAGLVTAPISSAALFVPTERRGRTAGVWPATRRLVLALIGTAVLAALIAGVLIVLGFSRTVAIAAAAALGTEQWRRRVTRPAPVTAPPSELPFVSLQVPAHNEPPEMVIQTLTSLLRIDYPRYEVIAIDDNTEDEGQWRPVADWCASHGVKFQHLQDWPGYKSGALNYALRNLTDPAAELIGVVDSDYQIDSSFLRRCVGLFADPKVAFIQAPQDYRDWEDAPYYRRLYYS